MKVNPAKIKKMSKYLRIVTVVFFWVTIIMGAVLTAVDVILQSGMIQLSGSMGITLDNVMVYNIPESELSGHETFMTAMIPMIIILVAIFAIILKQVEKILKSVENDSPFEEKNAERLTTIGVVLIISSFLVNILKGIAVSAAIESFRIPNFKVNYSVDPTMLLVGFLVLILAGVFQYGSYLQKEYDATL